MKIAILTTDSREHYKTYGAAQPSFGTAPEALLQGFASMPEVEVHVVSCTRQSMQSPPKIGKNIWYHSVVVPNWGWMRTLYTGCVRAVRNKLKEIQPDIVHGQGTEKECAISAVRSGFPNVVTLHGIMREQARLIAAPVGSFYWLASRLERFALRRTAGVLCNSQYTENAVAALAPKRWRVPNPVRQQFFEGLGSPQASAKCVLMNIGLVTPRKRQNELLRLAKELHDEGIDFELQFFGEAGDQTLYGKDFLSAVQRNSSFVTHPGFKPLGELIQYCDSANALVHVPTEESFGLVVAEALARNMKLFGFKVGGIVDIAQGVDGVELFEDGDWGGLKEAIRKWNRAGSPRAHSAAPVMRERYHPTVIANRHLEIYREVLSTRS